MDYSEVEKQMLETDKKYGFTGETINIIGEDNQKHLLHRIVALKDFETVTGNK